MGVGAVRGGCDAVFLALHGAMVAEHVDDGEGELLRRIRAVAPRVPIAVGLAIILSYLIVELGDEGGAEFVYFQF